MKYLKLESWIIISAMLVKDREEINKIVRYMCSDMDCEYDEARKKLSKHLRRLKRSLFKDGKPVTQEKIDKVKKELQVYTGEED